MSDNFTQILINGAIYTLAGTLAICTLGTLAIRRKLKPKNSWRSEKTLEGCTVLITGGNSGIGAATAKELARRQARVIIACRTHDTAQQVIREVKDRFPASHEILFKHLDLSSLRSVNEFVSLLDIDKIDILLNNAGVIGSHVTQSADDYEQTFATNYLAPFYLTSLIINKYNLKKVINVSSGLHHKGKICVSDLDSLIRVPSELNRDVYKQLYATSKLAQIYHTKELAERYPDIVSCSLHPGLVYTSLARYVKPNSILLSLLAPLARFLPLIIRTPDEGAQTSVYCCVEDGIENGAYYGDCEKETLKDCANDRQIQTKLWDFSEKLLSQKGFVVK